MAEEESKNSKNDYDDVALGKKLQLLRESRGYTIEDVAGQLYLDGSLIRALESGDYKDLPSKAYVKGYIRNFIKLFDAMSEFKSFNLFETNSVPLKITPSTFKLKRSRKLQNFKFNNLFYLIIICVFLGGLYYLEVKYAPINKIIHMVPLSDLSSIITEEKSTKHSTFDLNTDFVIKKQIINADDSEIINSALIKSDSINMQFSHDSWTQVKDATGSKLISRFVKSGKVLKFRGKLPFTVTLGNSRAVKIRVNGNDFNQSKYNKKEIAHFVINKTNLN